LDFSGNHKLAGFETPFEVGGWFSIGRGVVFGIALPPIGLADRPKDGVKRIGNGTGFPLSQTRYDVFYADLFRLDEYVAPCIRKTG
jgi:hypothetical protein